MEPDGPGAPSESVVVIVEAVPTSVERGVVAARGARAECRTLPPDICRAPALRPRPRRCDNAALYTGWYSLNNYNDAFTWSPGAIGFHLDSLSAFTPRGGENWAANALTRGITVTSGAVAEPYLEGLAHADGVFRNLFEGAPVGDAFLRNTAYLKWMIINLGDPLYRPFPNGIAPFNSPNHVEASLESPP